MFFVKMDAVKPGDVVARAIYDGRETPLVNSGSSLTAYEIKRLKSLGFQGIYVKGSQPATEEGEHVISVQMREFAVGQVSEAFSALREGGVLPVDNLQTSIDHMLKQILGERTVVSSLTNLRTHDNYTFEHSVNVAALAMMVGQEAGLAPDRLQVLGLGALLHDVGKTSVSPSILRKPEGLTDVEYRNIQEHPRLGYEILQGYRDLDPSIGKIAWQHHERIDGKGYPRRIKGPAIDPLAKIVSVCDVFDALTADRVYRDGMPTVRVLEILKKDAGSAFDPDVVELITRRVAPYPVGSIVRLNTGQVATVVGVGQEQPDRPVLKAVVDRGGRPLEQPLTLDLRYNSALDIVDVVVA